MGRGAEKLLERMRASKDGWGASDLDTLYTGFGFLKREGAKHVTYYHPDYDDLNGRVARHTKLAKGYISHAIKVIDTLNTRKGSTGRSPNVENS